MTPHIRESVTYQAVEIPVTPFTSKYARLPFHGGPIDGEVRDVEWAQFVDGMNWFWYRSDDAPYNRMALYEVVWRWTKRHGYEGLALRWVVFP